MKRVFSSYLWKMPEDRVRSYAREFATTVVSQVAYEKSVEALKQHQVAGRITILNSASPDFYVEEIAAMWGFDHFLGTNLIVEDPMPFLPEITGPNNKHGAKITAMRDQGLLPDEFEESDPDARLPDSYAYSDSSADVPLLSVCEKGTMIHPGPRFAEIGSERGWDTWLPPRPYTGKAGDRWSQIRQALGIYKIPE